jgi:hypothetical protein
MTGPRLRPCPICSRHARVSESVCPFCGASLGEAFRTAPPSRRPSGRLARAALVSLGTGAIALTPSCGSLPKDESGGIAPIDASADSGVETEFFDGGGVFAAYGGPVLPSDLNCTTVQDCTTAFPDVAVCCVQELCVSEANTLSVACADPLVQMIQASNYDQSCDADTDCVAVAEGNFCVPGANNCPSAAIGKGAKSKYLSDVANTNAAFCLAPSTCGVPLTCAGSTGPWCLHGTCEMATCPRDAGPDAPFELDGQAVDAGDGGAADDGGGD